MPVENDPNDIFMDTSGLQMKFGYIIDTVKAISDNNLFAEQSVEVCVPSTYLLPHL